MMQRINCFLVFLCSIACYAEQAYVVTRGSSAQFGTVTVSGDASAITSFAIWSIPVTSTTALLPPPLYLLSYEPVAGETGIIVSSDGTTLYILTKNGIIYSLPADGSAALTLFATITPFAVIDEDAAALALGFDADSSQPTIYVVINNEPTGVGRIVSFPINNPSSQTTRVAGMTGPFGAIAISLTNPSIGYLLEEDKQASSGSIYSFDTSAVSGSPTFFLSDSSFNDSNALTIDPSGQTLFVGGDTIQKVVVSSKNISTIGGISNNTILALAVTSDGTAVWATTINKDPSKNVTSIVTSFPVDGSVPLGTTVTTLPYQYGMAITITSTSSPPSPPTPSLLPPTNFTGAFLTIGILPRTLFYVQLDWEMPAGGSVPTSGYKIYRNTVPIAQVDAETYSFKEIYEERPTEGRTILYSISSVIGTTESLQTSISIKIP